MNRARFPVKRGDGSFEVHARFDVPTTLGHDRLRQTVRAWPDDASDLDSNEVLTDLVGMPHTVSVDARVLDVVFEGRPGSTMWKGWMVRLTSDLIASVPEARFLGFWDEVAGAMHQAAR